MRYLESVLFVAYACFMLISILNCIRYQCLTLIIYHVVVNIITIVYTLVKLAKSHHCLLSLFVCVCLFKLLFAFLFFFATTCGE